MLSTRLIALALSLACCTTQASGSGCDASAAGVDIVGITLGSQAPHAAKRLSAHRKQHAIVHQFDRLNASLSNVLSEIRLGAELDPNNPVQAAHIPGPNYDGQPMELPAWARAGRRGDENIRIGLALPPSQPCVNAIYRQRTDRWQNAPSLDAVTRGLTGKYGKPHSQSDKRKHVRMHWKWPMGAQLCANLQNAVVLDLNLTRVVKPAPQGSQCATELITELVYSTQTPDKPVVRIRSLLIDVQGSAANLVAFRRYADNLAKQQRKPSRPSL